MKTLKSKVHLKYASKTPPYFIWIFIVVLHISMYLLKLCIYVSLSLVNRKNNFLEQ